MKKTQSRYKDLIHKLVFLYKGYMSTYRASIHQLKVDHLGIVEFNVHDKNIRENLLEHSGHLPITAVTIFPYINDKDVNLGEALIMLAIEDVGELKTGDTMTFLKDYTNLEEEQKQAFALLDKQYFEPYQDIINQRTATGKYAKSIDKMVADIIELVLDPKISHKRYKIQVGFEPKEIVPAKRAKKMKYMEWNPFLQEFYKCLLEELDAHLT